jgi:hypothetical protein
VIAARHVVTSSGFTFERRGDTVILSGCDPKAAPAAVLEYLREIEPGKPGRIIDGRRAKAGGRALEIVTVEVAGSAPRTLSFDVGPSRFGQVRSVLDAVNVGIHVVGLAAALGAVGYLVKTLLVG